MEIVAHQSVMDHPVDDVGRQLPPTCHTTIKKQFELPIAPFPGMRLSEGDGYDTVIEYVTIDTQTKEIRCAMHIFYVGTKKQFDELVETKRKLGWEKSR